MDIGKWTNPSDGMPERNVPIEWMDSAGNISRGKFIGVWMMDDGMYIYYLPSFWRYANTDPCRTETHRG